MTKEQLSYAGRVSQKVQALRRLAEGDRCDIPVRSGLQLGCIMLDCRAKQFITHTGLLFKKEGYENRYLCMRDFERQQGLFGCHDLVRDMTKEVRPLLSL